MNKQELFKNVETKSEDYTLLPTDCHSVEDRPLVTKDERGNWICTEKMVTWKM